jgi:photosystem II stability/assembly factor-like uncharacterized protein
MKYFSALNSSVMFAAALYTGTAQASPSASPPIAQNAGGEWLTSPTEPYRGKRDDIVFANVRTGYYGTGAGDVFRSDDGGSTWRKVWSKPGTFVRSLGFIDADNGFLGNVGDAYPNVTDKIPLYRTRDGGRTWTPVDIGDATVEGICAIDVLKTRAIYQGKLTDRVVIHAAGRVSGPARLLRSIDGGETWSFIDMSSRAGMILDVKFLDANTGFVFAASSSDIANSQALILKTRDGGRTWREVYRSPRKFELIWKGSFVGSQTGFATVQTYDHGRSQQVVVKTTNGGDSWKELPLVSDPKALEFGVGFTNAKIGWVGTAIGGFETRDGGVSWKRASIAPAANKIRVRASDGTPMIIAIGTQVQRFVQESQH